MILTIVVCFATAGVVGYSELSKRKPKWPPIPANQKVWLLCGECELSWEMGMREYYKYLGKHQNPLSMEPPGVLCGGCGEEGGYRAEKCGLIFERGSVAHDFADRCPECGFIGAEASRKAARRAREANDG